MKLRKPRCYLVYALAPAGVTPADANTAINEFVADKNLPLSLFHDHFIGQLGGMAVFFVDTIAERDALLGHTHLPGWQVTIHPMIYAHNPAAFDEQTAYTLRQYRGVDWAELRQEKRPSYGSPSREAQTGVEDFGE